MFLKLNTCLTVFMSNSVDGKQIKCTAYFQHIFSISSIILLRRKLFNYHEHCWRKIALYNFTTQQFQWRTYAMANIRFTTDNLLHRISNEFMYWNYIKTNPLCRSHIIVFVSSHQVHQSCLPLIYFNASYCTF